MDALKCLSLPPRKIGPEPCDYWQENSEYGQRRAVISTFSRRYYETHIRHYALQEITICNFQVVESLN